MITHEMIVLFIFGIVGLFIHHLIKWNEAKQNNRKYKLNGKFPSILIVIVGMATIVFLGEEVKDFFVPTKVSMLFLGYGGHSVILRIFQNKAPNDNV